MTSLSESDAEKVRLYKENNFKPQKEYQFSFPVLPTEITSEISCLQGAPLVNAEAYGQCLSDYEVQDQFAGLYKDYLKKNIKQLVVKIKATQDKLDSIGVSSYKGEVLSKRLYFLRSLYYRAQNKDIIISWREFDNESLSIDGYHSEAVQEYLK